MGKAIRIWSKCTADAFLAHKLCNCQRILHWPLMSSQILEHTYSRVLFQLLVLSGNKMVISRTSECPWLCLYHSNIVVESNFISFRYATSFWTETQKVFPKKFFHSRISPWSVGSLSLGSLVSCCFQLQCLELQHSCKDMFWWWPNSQTQDCPLVLILHDGIIRLGLRTQQWHPHFA